MAFSPRNNEVEAVVGLLEDDSFESAEQVAKAIVKALGAEFARRDMYFVVPPDGALAWGPFYSERDVRKAWESEIGPATGGRGRFFRSYPFNSMSQSADAEVCECGHFPEQHVVKALRGGKVSAPQECGPCAHSVKKGAPNDCAQYTRRTA